MHTYTPPCILVSRPVGGMKSTVGVRMHVELSSIQPHSSPTSQFSAVKSLKQRNHPCTPNSPKARNPFRSQADINKGKARNPTPTQQTKPQKKTSTESLRRPKRARNTKIIHETQDNKQTRKNKTLNPKPMTLNTINGLKRPKASRSAPASRSQVMASFTLRRRGVGGGKGSRV